jgi:predicted RNA-binding protein with PUA-like domain
VAGVAQVVKQAYPDFTAFDPNHPYYDAKYQDQSNPRWFMVDVQFVRQFKNFVPLTELKTYASGQLRNMVLLHRGRLSVQPVAQDEFDFICSLGDKEE